MLSIFMFVLVVNVGVAGPTGFAGMARMLRVVSVGCIAAGLGGTRVDRYRTATRNLRSIPRERLLWCFQDKSCDMA